MRVRVALSALAFVASDATSGEPRPAARPARPVLTLRASPPAALSPASVLLVAELKGGDEAEEFYCPRVEWNFDNGRRSSHEEDCEPFEETSRIERRFLVRHSFTQPGTYWVAISLWRADREVARAATSLYITASSSDGGGPFAAANR